MDNDTKMELPKNYNHKEIEEKWYNFWISNEYNKSYPDNSKESYTILACPPNLSGDLHIGHALNVSFQDTLIRYKKLNGYNTLYLPGYDHGGISTQYVVEKDLLGSGISRNNLTRDDFLKKIHEWKDNKQSNIRNQLKKLGCLSDWTREQYTMNENLSEQVRKAFVHLYKKNYIYKGKYIINWCPKCITALSDDEVVHEDQISELFYLKYYLEDNEDFLIIATTRPETIFGDVAVAFNSKDSRYNTLLNKRVKIPLTNKYIPLIPDELVIPSFGTGLVKITPAHDKTDFEISKKHNLEPIYVLNQYGKICNSNKQFDGLDRFKARKEIVNELHNNNLIDKIVKHKNSVGICYKCNTIIEPYLSEQWFLKMEPFVKSTLDIINKNKIRIIPEHNIKILNNWFDDMKDWCLSRQLVFGHRIPIWYCLNCNNTICEMIDPTKCNKCGNDELEKDNDVLDTWFSSGLWGFSVFDNKENLDYYFPTSVLITGKDIIFFWVARMIMFSIEFTNNIPFKEVFLHGIIRDDKGDKISKSKGNVIDPLIIIDKYSCDAMRFSLLFLTPFGQDVKLNHNSFNIGKTFCTKLWNCCRYLLLNLNIDKKYDFNQINFKELKEMDLWIINKLNKTIIDINKYFNEYNFIEAIKVSQYFIWEDFCSNYLELIKPYIQNNQTQLILLYLINNILILFHPIIPFITEELWQSIKIFIINYKDKKSILETNWPKQVNINYDSNINKLCENINLCLTKIRIFKKNQTVLKLSIQLSESNINFFEKYRLSIIKITKLNELIILPKIEIKFDENLIFNNDQMTIIKME